MAANWPLILRVSYANLKSFQRPFCMETVRMVIIKSHLNILEGAVYLRGGINKNATFQWPHTMCPAHTIVRFKIGSAQRGHAMALIGGIINRFYIKPSCVGFCFVM